MGCSAALCLARRGARVTLLDAAPRPCVGASRWNEGKIHLGYLYAADPSLATARRVLDGGLAFKPLIERLIGQSLEAVTSPDDDIYLVHRRSVVDADGMARYYAAVSALVREHGGAAGYLCPAAQASAHRLSASELAALCDTPESWPVPRAGALGVDGLDRRSAGRGGRRGAAHRRPVGLRVTGVRRPEAGATPRCTSTPATASTAPTTRRERAVGRTARRRRRPGPAAAVDLVAPLRRSLFVRTSRPGDPAERRDWHRPVRRHQELQRPRPLLVVVPGGARRRRGRP